MSWFYNNRYRKPEFFTKWPKELSSYVGNLDIIYIICPYINIYS